MSTWRDIWRKTVKANRVMAQNETAGLSEFDKLFKKYGDDGMIHYALGESWEYRRDKAKALEEYRKARDRFPVAHWKKIADDTITRVSKNQSAEQFYDKDDFDELLWMAFQKVYEFVHLGDYINGDSEDDFSSDFARYVSLSALSRGASEWPLSLVDFRTVTELEIKHYFPDVIVYVDANYSDSSLFNYLQELKKRKEVPKTVYDAMNQIRDAGNLAAHDMKAYEKDRLRNVDSFLKVLEYFNDL